MTGRQFLRLAAESGSVEKLTFATVRSEGGFDLLTRAYFTVTGPSEGRDSMRTSIESLHNFKGWWSLDLNKSYWIADFELEPQVYKPSDQEEEL